MHRHALTFRAMTHKQCFNVIFHKAFVLEQAREKKSHTRTNDACHKIRTLESCSNSHWLFCLSRKLFRQLDDASCSVYMENVRLNEALKYHTKESEDLQKLANSLAQENAGLASEKVCLGP